MDERSFEIGAKKFKLSKIDPFKQFHIVRRLGPILGDIVPLAKRFKGAKDGQMSEEQMWDVVAEFAGPFMNGLSKLSDKDAEMVLFGLCSSAEVHQPEFNSWARVADGERLLMQNLELPEILKIAGRAFAFNLSGFFATAQQTSRGGK